MKTCKTCMYPENHALGLVIDENGICSGCSVHYEKYEIDWRSREDELSTILSQYKRREGSSYDCVIPVSGTGDDFFVVDTMKNKFGLNPLLVTYNTHFNTSVGVRNLARLITCLDADHMMSTVGPDTVKELTRITFEKFGDMYWHVLAGSQTFPVQVATKLDIPLIIWGVNGWLDQVGMFSHHDRVEMTKKVRKEHSLRGVDADALAGLSERLSHKDLQAFTYPTDYQLERSRVRGLYLGNFVFWDSQRQTENAINRYGYETQTQERTYNTYESIGCFNNASVHDYIKYLKFGYGKVNDHVARDIRLGRIDKKAGLALIESYLHKKPVALDLFCQWIGISRHDFYLTVNKFRNQDVWERTALGEYNYIGPFPMNPVSDVRQSNEENKLYVKTKLLEDPSIDQRYILLGRTYMDKNNYKAVEG